jgi:hypothetical protein
VHTGHEQFEKAGAIDPEHLEVMRRGAARRGHAPGQDRDGHAILYTEWSTQRSLRYIKQAATNLISMTMRAEPEWIRPRAAPEMHIINASDFVVWGLPMLTEFQLVVLITFVTVALVVVCVMLPVRI